MVEQIIHVIYTNPRREKSTYSYALTTGYACRTNGNLEPIMNCSCFYHTQDMQDE